MSERSASRPLFVHGTCVVLGERAVLLRGPSGAGKSDLAFRLVSASGAYDARLVADDQVCLKNEAGRLMASSPAELTGLLELRGLGLAALSVAENAEVRLLVDLVPRDAVPRLPESRFESILGVALPALSLHAFDLSVADKLRLALETIPDCGFPGHDGRLGGERG